MTEVALPGAGSMQTADAPGFGMIAAIALLGASLFGLLFFSLFGLVYRLKWQAASRGIDVDRVAA